MTRLCTTAAFQSKMEGLHGRASIHGDLKQRPSIAVGSRRKAAVDDADRALQPSTFLWRTALS